MNTANRTILATAAAPMLTLAALAFGQSDMGGMQPQDPVESFAGYELAAYGYDEHFCWPLADTPHAEAEALAAAMGETQTPVYTFELHTGQRWDMCLWPADGDWEEEWDYRNCDFARTYHDSNWNDVIYGEADGAEYSYSTLYSGPQDETIVYAGSIADKMICVDSKSYRDPAHADLLLFEGDTRPGESDDGGAATGPRFAEDASIGDLVFTVGVAIESITFPEATGGDIDATLNDGELSDYSFDPAELPAGLTFNRFTRVMEGTPTRSLEKTDYTFWVHDDDEDYGAEDRDGIGFTITIMAASSNRPGESDDGDAATGPRFAEDASIGDLVFTVGVAIESITFPEATGGDIDATLNDGELSDYSFDPAELPAGLTFNRFTRVMEGTPTRSLEKTDYTFWVHDDDEDYGAEDRDGIGFTITIMAASSKAAQLL